MVMRRVVILGFLVLASCGGGADGRNDGPCESDQDCGQGYTCILESGLCVPACDRDEDGVEGSQCGSIDCDDNDANRFPGNPEVCNGIDDDCNDDTLEGTDADDDGYCVEGGPLPCCAGIPADCCDQSSDAYPGQVAWFVETGVCGWDFDCSGEVELQWGSDITALCGCGVNRCYVTGEPSGWEESLGAGVPDCGHSGTWLSCAPELSMCLHDGGCVANRESRQQGCR